MRKRFARATPGLLTRKQRQIAAQEREATKKELLQHLTVGPMEIRELQDAMLKSRDELLDCAKIRSLLLETGRAFEQCRPGKIFTAWKLSEQEALRMPVAAFDLSTGMKPQLEA
jgi:hypothetical protein